MIKCLKVIENFWKALAARAEYAQGGTQ